MNAIDSRKLAVALLIVVLFWCSIINNHHTQAVSISCAKPNELCGGFVGMRCCDTTTECIYDKGSAGHCRKIGAVEDATAALTNEEIVE